MSLAEKAKDKTNPWIQEPETQKLNKYSYSIKARPLRVSPVPIQGNTKIFNLLKDNNGDIYVTNQTKTATGKASLLRSQSRKQMVDADKKEIVFFPQKNNYRRAKQTTNRLSSYLRQAEIRDTFMKLANQWRKETKHMSLMSDIVLHPAYQQIIGMGADAVPLILEELSREPEHWFWALRSITKANPIKPEDRGRLKKMAEAWLDWGRQHGYKC